ncbi:TrgA family protein [Cognatishimia sp. F0-27]|uniref:TrgA family protein n=1 Tax=Cognatishimia sp. F0-27 TaxID=2816855 RepID=UPI001D0C280C|nr:TrgA family protein [Cognatishimia sp. F0-27]MCC1492279.1 TrgA family protein [Cognatishimia sp. F0-27]
MPTFPKLVAALGMAVLALLASQRIMTFRPEGTDFGNFIWVNLALGLVMGWVVIGRRAGRGMAAGVSNGFTGVVALVFWGLFVQAVAQMVELANRNRYSGPFEALSDIFQIMADYGLELLDAPLITMLLVGAIVIGLVTEIAALRRG